MVLAAPALADNGSLVWTAPNRIDGYAINALSCPSISFCVAVDDHGDVLSSTDPLARAGHWQSSDVDGTNALTGLSCASPSVCVAVDGQGNAVTTINASGPGSAWTIAPIDRSVLEPSPYGGGPDLLRGVSCPTASFCVAVDSVGNALYSDNPTGGPGAWRMTHIDNNSGYGCTGGGLTCQASLMGISCPAVLFCAAVDFTGNILQTRSPARSTAWSSHSAGGGGPQSLWSVSCPTSDYCATVDGRSGNVFTWDPATEMRRAAHRLPADAFGIWCRSATLCLASGEGDNGVSELLGSTNPAARSPNWAVTGFGDINTVSCPSASICLAADNQGQVMEGVTVAGLSTRLRRQALGGDIPKLGALLRKGGCKVRFASPIAGRLQVRWQAYGIVLATASARFTASRTRSIPLWLTPKGSALLRGARRIAVNASARFATNTGSVRVQLRRVLTR